MTKNKKADSERPVKIGGAAKDLVEKLKKNGGWGKYDQQAGFKGGKVFLPGIQLSIRLQDLKELTRPENPTPYMVEVVRIGRSSYLHLVKKPPLEILEAIIQRGAGHYTASNDIGGMDALDTAAPSNPVAPKTPAKKAKEVPQKHPANKPEPAVKLTPEQQRIATAKKTAAIALELVAARSKKR